MDKLKNSLKTYPALRYALLGALGCLVGGLLGELFLRPPAPVTRQPDAISLLIDVSGSMAGNRLREVQNAAISFVQQQDLTRTQVAIVSFDSSAQIRSPLTRDRAQLERAIRNLQTSGTTNMSRGIETANRSLAGSQFGVILLFIDGFPDNAQATLTAANGARNAGLQLAAIATADGDYSFLERVTENPNLVFPTSDGNFLQAFTQAQATINNLFGTQAQTGGAAFRDALLLSALVALALGAFLIVAENTLSLRGRWWRDLYWVPFAAALLGAIGGGLGQVFFSLFGNRAFGWAIMGAGAGLLLGLADRSKLKAQRGAIGGAIGGFIGGAVFSPIAQAVPTGALNSLSRLLAFAILGFAIGLMLYLAQEFFKSAWLMGTSLGPYEGKHYILSKNSVTLGRSDANDINLYHERDLPLQAGAFTLQNGKWFWQGQGVEVNRVVTANAALSSGDRLRFGTTEFVFRLSGQTEGVKRQYVLHGDAASYPLKGSRVFVGQAADNGIVLMDSSVAPKHAELRVTAGGLELIDLGSGETRVNDEPLEPRASRSLKAGDLLTLGRVDLALITEN